MPWIYPRRKEEVSWFVVDGCGNESLGRQVFFVLKGLCMFETTVGRAKFSFDEDSCP